MPTTDTNRPYFQTIWIWYYNYFYYFSTTGTNASIDITAPINESSEPQQPEHGTKSPNPTTDNKATKTDSSKNTGRRELVNHDHDGTESSNPSDVLLPILILLFVGLVIAGAIATTAIYYKKRSTWTVVEKHQKDDIEELV